MGATSAALKALGAGGVVVIPTETVWGLCARLDRPAGIERIRALKRRPEEKPLQVLVHDPLAIPEVGVLDDTARAVADRFMPGPLTLVVRARDQVPHLGGRPGTVGIRVPDHPLPRELALNAGPLAATSANRSGDPTPQTLEGIRAVFGDEVDVYLEDPAAGQGVPSSVLDLSGPEPRLLREGAVPRKALEEALGRTLLRGW